jgi:uncharacterized membrane protein HdeD (DUF308 family)
MEVKPFKNWWFLSVNGIIAMLIGIILELYTKDSITEFIKYFGIFVLAAGVLLLITALIKLKKDKGVMLLMIQSVTSIGLGIFLLLSMDNSVRIFQILLGVWAVVLGIMQLVILVNVRQNLTNKNVFLFNGLMTITFGVVMFFYPLDFPEFIIKILGGFAILLGIILIYLSVILRKIAHVVETDQVQ